MDKHVTFGDNVVGTIADNKLTLVIDLAKRGGPSKSGKTLRVASTEGNTKVARDAAGHDIYIGFNAYAKPASA